MNINIRKELSSDIDAIHALTAAAFLNAPHTGHNQQFIVKGLREAGQLAVSLVAEDGGVIVGHVALSPVSISDGVQKWYGLGPISVAPEHQRQGVGSQLMQQALVELRAIGAAGGVVLGEPDFYGRFGFKAEPTLVLPDVPPEYFQANTLKGAVPKGIVSYHAAFYVES